MEVIDLNDICRLCLESRKENESHTLLQLTISQQNKFQEITQIEVNDFHSDWKCWEIV